MTRWTGKDSDLPTPYGSGALEPPDEPETDETDDTDDMADMKADRDEMEAEGN